MRQNLQQLLLSKVKKEKNVQMSQYVQNIIFLNLTIDSFRQLFQTEGVIPEKKLQYKHGPHAYFSDLVLFVMPFFVSRRLPNFGPPFFPETNA